jgi:formate-nitrite transporter family protein
MSDNAEGQGRGRELSPEEKQQAEDHTSVPVPVVHEAVRRQGEEELRRPAQALAWSGFAAGLSMSVSLVTQGLLQTYLPDAPWRRVIVKMGYSVGYLLVVAGRQQLFTENTLTPIIPLLAQRDLPTFLRVMKLWTVVLLANLAGAHCAAWVLSNTSAFDHNVQHSFDVLAHEAVAVGFGAAILRGIFSGWLIASMVWILAAVEDGKILVILIITYLVGLGGLTHIIAGSVDALFLVWNGTLAWSAYAMGYALPALIGNVIGGVSLVSALNHAQVVAGSPQNKARRDPEG